jgi:hypothetical protein
LHRDFRRVRQAEAFGYHRRLEQDRRNPHA